MHAGGFERPVSEEDLHSFVDGELDGGRRQAVQAFLDSSPADARRVDRWRKQNDALRAACAQGETVAPLRPAPLACETDREPAGKAAPRGAQSWRERWFAWSMGLAFAAGALLAAGALYLASRPSLSANAPAAPNGPAPAAESARPAVGAASAPPGGPAGQEPAAAERERAEPILPTILAGDFKLAGVRPLPGDGPPMLCLLYAGAEAADVVLCAGSAAGGDERVAGLAGRFPAASVRWRQNGALYVLAGGLPEQGLRRLADKARAQIDAFAGR